VSNSGRLRSRLQPERPNKDHLVRSAGVVSAAVLLSRLTGLAREIAFARLFGAGIVKDAYDVGFRIPNLTRDLFAEGALSSAFVPTFTRYLAQQGREEAAHLARLVATALMVIVGALCAAGIWFSPAIVSVFADSFHAIPGKFELTVALTRTMFPFLLLVALAAQAMGALNANNIFGIPALASTFFNLGSLGSGLLLAIFVAPRLDIPPIFGMAVGVVIGGALQLAFQLPALTRTGFHFRPAFDWSHPGLREIFALMGPAILGNASVQVNVLVNTWFATGLTDAAGRVLNGPVSWLGYAFRFMQLPLGLFGVAIASAALPSVSRSAASGDHAELRSTLSHALSIVFLLTIPAAVGLIVLAEPMIAAIVQGGRFTATDTEQTALALACYAVGLPGYAAVKVLVPAFYALGNSRTPTLISFVSIAVNYSVAVTMIRVAGFGHAGLALSTSSVALFSFCALLWQMRQRLGGIDGRMLLGAVTRIALAAVPMGLVCWFASHWLQMALGLSRWARLADLAVSVPLGLAVFYGVARILKIEVLDETVRAITEPLSRRLSRGARR